MYLAWMSVVLGSSQDKRQTFLCSHTSQMQSTPLLHYVFVFFFAAKQLCNLSTWKSSQCRLSLTLWIIISFTVNVLFSALHRGCRGFAFMCLCVCFCLHPCFTQDYDCNDVEGKLHNILLTLYLSHISQCVTPAAEHLVPGPVWIHFECVYNGGINLWLLQGEGMQIQTGPVFFSSLVCIPLPFLLCESASPWTYNCSAPSSYHLSTDTQLHIDPTLHILSRHLTSPWIKPTLA